MANKAYPPSICPGIPRLGKCPTGWTTCTFGDVLTVVERLVPIADESVYQLVTAKRNRGGIVPREQLKGKEIKTQGQYTVRKGDFLIGNRQIIHGACGIVPESLDGAIVSGEYTVLLPKKGLWLPWLAYFAHTVHFQQTCFQSSIGVDVEKMVFKVDWWLKQLLHIPPLTEQKHIVEILSTWDDTLGQKHALIRGTKCRKTAIMQQLLFGTKRLRGHSGKWTTMALRNVASIEYGCDWKSVADINGSVPVFGTGGQIGRATKALATGPVVLVGRKGSIDQPQLVTGQFWAVDTTFILKPIGDTNVRWLYECLCHRGLAQYNEASGVPSLSRTTVESLQLLVPPQNEQCTIAAVLSSADDEIHALEDEVKALERQKKGLMQQLLTGEVRVKG